MVQTYDKHMTTSAFCFLCSVQIISLSEKSWHLCFLNAAETSYNLNQLVLSLFLHIITSQHMSDVITYLPRAGWLFPQPSFQGHIALEPEAGQGKHFLLSCALSPKQSRADAQLSSPTSSPLMSLFSTVLVVLRNEEAPETQPPM